MLLAGWLLFLAAAQTFAFVELWRFFVHTEHGQLLDTIALEGNRIGRDRVDGPMTTVLNATSVLSVAIATGVAAFIALVRRRIALAFLAIVLIVGSNVTTQALKYGLYRPDFGVDVERASAGNSFPSGHATIATAIAVAFLLVLPSRARGIGALVGAVYAAFVGVATLSAGWHRPSDAVGAVLIVGAWTAAAGLVLLLVQRDDDVARSADGHRPTWIFMAFAAIVLFGVAVIALRLTDDVRAVPTDDLSRRRLFAAYAGSAAGITGAVSLLMALVLATAHRVVPGRVQVTDPDLTEHLQRV